MQFLTWLWRYGNVETSSILNQLFSFLIIRMFLRNVLSQFFIVKCFYKSLLLQVAPQFCELNSIFQSVEGLTMYWQIR